MLKALDLILVGFLIGFAVQVFSSAVFAYIVQMPIPPLKLLQEGLSMEEVNMVEYQYGMMQTAVTVVAISVSLVFVGYGVYRLVYIAKEERLKR